MYFARLAIEAANAKGATRAFVLVVGFRDQELFDTYADTGFDDLLDKLNENLPKGWFVDDTVEVEKILDGVPNCKYLVVLK